MATNSRTMDVTLRELRELQDEVADLRRRLDLAERGHAPADPTFDSSHDNVQVREILFDSTRAKSRGGTTHTPQTIKSAVAERRVTRRTLLGSVGAATLGVLAVNTLTGIGVAKAANGGAILAGDVNTSTSPTALAVTQASVGSGVYGFGVIDVSLTAFPEKSSLAGHTNGTYDSAVLGYDQNGAIGVHGISNGAIGVRGDGLTVGVEGKGKNAGVSGISQKGIGVMGAAGPGDDIIIETGAGIAIYGEGSGDALGVVGISELNTTKGGGAVSGLSFSSRGNLAGVYGASLGSGPGVYASSKTGRGVVSESKLAQLRLVPSNAKTHPNTGERGDLFVDSSARLWYCTQGGNHPIWVKLA